MKIRIDAFIAKLKFLLLCLIGVAIFVSCDPDTDIPEKVTIRFETNGGTAIEPVEVAFNTIVTKPANPVKENAAFWNWYKDPDFKLVFDFTQPLINDLTLYAKWITTYVVNYETFGGTNITPDTVFSGNYLMPIQLIPKKTGYKFSVWCSDITLNSIYDFNTPVTANTTLYAKYTDEFTLTFDTRGGASLQPMMVKGNSTITNPVMTHPKGYTFWQWRTKEGKVFNPETQPIIEDLTLYAIWNMPASMFRVESGKFWGLKPEFIATTEYVDIPANLPGLTTPGINDYNFYDNAVVKSISIPSDFTYIGANAFALCPNLKSIFIYGVREIGTQIIKNSGLEEINIPGTVTKISDSFALCTTYTTVHFHKPEISPEPALELNWIFWGASGLEKIIFDRTTPPTFGANMLNSTKLKEIIVPAESYSAYREAWPAYARIMKKQ